MNIQIIEHNGTPEYAVIPFAEWRAITDRLEELEDIADAKSISAGIASGEETFPLEFSKRLASRESPLKVLREYRGLTLAALGKKCGVSAAALSQIETGKRSPSVDLLGKLSRALGCDMDDLCEVGELEMAA
ncbi:MAG: helix-turn-helix transcriptional regulator [Deltaproteobacteria bacterium]|nr:helix-turn-helix transcriptional regulator [Deltaproteobacteria bacterium]